MSVIDRRAATCRLVWSEGGFKTKRTPEDDDDILQRSSRLVACHLLPRGDQVAEERNLRGMIDEEPSKALARGVEAGRVIESAGERQQFLRCQFDRGFRVGH